MKKYELKSYFNSEYKTFNYRRNEGFPICLGESNSHHRIIGFLGLINFTYPNALHRSFHIINFPMR